MSYKFLNFFYSSFLICQQTFENNSKFTKKRKIKRKHRFVLKNSWLKQKKEETEILKIANNLRKN